MVESKHSARRPDRTHDPLLERIESILRRQLLAYEHLESLLERKREAIRQARANDMAVLCHEEHPLVQRIAELEKERLTAVGVLTEQANPGAAHPLAMREIALLAEGEQRERLIGLGARVVEVVERVQRQSSVLRAAAEQLSRHITGVLQVVQGALSQAGVYGRRGRLAVGVPVQSMVDFKS